MAKCKKCVWYYKEDDDFDVCHYHYDDDESPCDDIDDTDDIYDTDDYENE